ncbi:MAG: histidine phosphatase family protein [Acetobacteraceae bacterium]|nr:histidine phosphatase family protein [Acetobacteraceae bacterium]
MTTIHLIRHAPVAPEFLVNCYGATDVPVAPVCERISAGLARVLPRPAAWYVTPLSRTRATAEAIFAAGYDAVGLSLAPAFIEQDFGALQGIAHDVLAQHLKRPPHPFWIIDPDEVPDGGESSTQVKARVGPALEALAARHDGGDVVVIAHGGSIRAAVAHAMDIPMRAAMHFSIRNQSLTRLLRNGGGWHVLGVNEQVSV